MSGASRVFIGDFLSVQVKSAIPRPFCIIIIGSSLGGGGGGIAHDARRERRQLCGFRNLADGSCDVDRERARCFYNFNYEIWEKFVLRWHALHLRRGAFLYSLSQVRGIASVQPRHKGDSVAIAALL